MCWRPSAAGPPTCPRSPFQWSSPSFKRRAYMHVPSTQEKVMVWWLCPRGTTHGLEAGGFGGERIGEVNRRTSEKGERKHFSPSLLSCDQKDTVKLPAIRHLVLYLWLPHRTTSIAPAVCKVSQGRFLWWLAGTPVPKSAWHPGPLLWVWGVRLSIWICGQREMGEMEFGGGGG